MLPDWLNVFLFASGFPVIIEDDPEAEDLLDNAGEGVVLVPVDTGVC